MDKIPGSFQNPGFGQLVSRFSFEHFVSVMNVRRFGVSFVFFCCFISLSVGSSVDNSKSEATKMAFECSVKYNGEAKERK